MFQSIAKTCIVSCFILLFSTCLIIFPEQSLHASVSGLHIWLEVVFPSLFPFFICSELFIRYGIAHFIGHLFEGIMRPLFKLPGIGSIAILIGMVSGYPSGAKVSAQLRSEKLITQTEGERLLAFTNNASPLFIFGVIAIGFYQNEQIGYVILTVHYVSNLFVGILMRFYRGKSDLTTTKTKQAFRPFDGLRKMHRVRIQMKEPLGQLLGDIIIQSVQTLCIIGGYIIIFSVLTTFLDLLSFQSIIAFFLHPIFALLQIPKEIIMPFITGLLEITLGTKTFTLSTISLHAQLIGICVLLGFNGLSVHAQVASIISTTDIRYFPYLLGRILHSVISLCLAFIVIPFFSISTTLDKYTFASSIPFYYIREDHALFLNYATLIPYFAICITCFILIRRLIISTH